MPAIHRRAALSYRRKLFIGAGSLLLSTTLVLTVLWFVTASRELRRRSTVALGDGLESVNLQLDMFLNSARKLSTYLVSSHPQYRDIIRYGPYAPDGSFQRDSLQFNKLVQSLYAQSSYAQAVTIVCQNGYAYTSGFPMVLYQVARQPYVQAALEADAVPVYIRHNANEYPRQGNRDQEALTMATPIRLQGEVLGVMLVDIDFGYIRRMYDLQILGGDARVVSILPDGALLYDTREADAASAVESAEALDAPGPSTALALAVAADSAGFLGQSVPPAAALPAPKPSSSGTQPPAAITPAPPAPDIEALLSAEWIDGVETVAVNGDVLTVVRSTAATSRIRTLGILKASQINARIYSPLRFVLIASPLLLLTMMLLVYLITGRQTRNLRSLYDTMMRISKDEAHVRAEIPGDDEIARLAQTFNAMMQRVEDLNAENERRVEERHKVELELFRAQINPHFIYNTLGTIRYLAILRGAHNIDEVTESLTAILRSSLGRSTDFTRLGDEVDMLRSYARIQQYRYLGQVTLSVTLPDGLAPAIIPRMILQPLVENALLHGYGEQTHAEVLSVALLCAREGDALCLTVIDEGCGIEGSRLEGLLDAERNPPPEPGAHIGLRNVHRRLRLLYGEAYGLTIESALGQGTRVAARLPLRFAGEEA